MTLAFDTSALAKLALDEDESQALSDFVVRHDRTGTPLVVSALAVTELRRLAIRMALPRDVASLLDPFQVVRLTQPVLDHAGALPHPHLGTLDAIHVASALLAEVPAFVTYDRRQATAARAEGLLVYSPGQDA